MLEAGEGLSRENLWCEDHFVNTHVWLPSGKYIVCGCHSYPLWILSQ